ncbi:MAG: hypothetical protein INR73_19910 [Williamsia sp.]|nr:hypothetical protein [Williamsia sp.]
MYKTILFRILVLFLIATVPIVVMTFFSYDSQLPRGGFKRRFAASPITMLGSFTNDKPLRDVCGSTQSHYFFTVDTPGKILITDLSFKQFRHINCGLEQTRKLSSLLLTFVDSPYVYFLAGNIPAIIKFHLESRRISFHKNKDQNFYLGVPISSTSFILKGYDSSTLTDQIFKRYTTTNDSVQYETGITPKQHDGGISDDGHLTYDKKSKLLIYMNYYFNRFICLDTNLQVLYKSKTIDTFNTSQIRATETTLPSGLKSFTPNSPPRLVNFQCCIYSDKIFINSLIAADNEDEESFRHNSVIDVYSLRNGSYLSSFYIPSLNSKRFNRFQVFGHTLFAIYSNVVATYKLNDG